MIYVVFLLVWTHGVLSHIFQEPLVNDQRPKIAIIGAGAGGSSAAYYLQKFTSNGYNVTIFEKNGYIGGRSTTIKNYDAEYPYDIELGGAIFVGANKILLNAAKEFNLTLLEGGSVSAKYSEKFDDSFGIWNGTDFVFTTSRHESKWKLLVRLLWRYKLSPIRTYRLVRSIVQNFVKIYYEDHFPFLGLDQVNEISGFDQLTKTIGKDYLLEKGISNAFSHEFIEAVTRVNYRSNINDIHGLETLVSLAADENIYSIKGGNYKIFERFIEISGSNLKLKANVSKITRKTEKFWEIDYIFNEEQRRDLFDHVILASPFHQTDIEYDGSILEPNKVEYRELYASYFETNRTQKINHPVFKDYQVPEQIFTIDSNLSSPFYSVSVVHYDNETDKIIYKVFSGKPIDDQFLKDNLFDENKTDFEFINVIFNKRWNPYPHLTPIENFTSFEIGENFWYLNTIESFISTMETSALAGANVAGLISHGKNTTEIRP